MELDLDGVRKRIDPAARPVALHLAGLLTDPGGTETAEVTGTEVEPDPAAGDDVEEVLRDASLATVWSAVEALHGALDETRSEGAPMSEVREARARLSRGAVRLVQRLLEHELRMQRSMLRDISHDIRSPLNSILFLADGLYAEQSGPLNKVQKRQLGVVYSAAASLLGFVNDLLDFARTEEGDVGGVAEVPFSVHSVVADVKRLVQPLVQHRGTEFSATVDVAGQRRGDPQLLTRVLTNLVSNAIEATGEGGEVEVRLESPSDAELRVVVADDGPGVDLERVRELTAPRSHRELTRMLQGRTHGLGFIICGRLVRAADGDLSVASEDGGGTRFRVTLPFPKDRG